jgi:hypothetical protein
MTTNGDMTPRQPDDTEPLSGDELDLIDQAVARITDTEVNEHLRRALNQSGHSGPAAWPRPVQLTSVKPEMLHAVWNPVSVRGPAVRGTPPAATSADPPPSASPKKTEPAAARLPASLRLQEVEATSLTPAPARPPRPAMAPASADGPSPEGYVCNGARLGEEPQSPDGGADAPGPSGPEVSRVAPKLAPPRPSSGGGSAPSPRM